MFIIGIVLQIVSVLAGGQNPADAGAGRRSTASVVIVRVETGLGNIDIAIDGEHAPVTAANFLKYVDRGAYNGGRFHRATRPDNYVPQLPERPPFQIVQADINPDRVRDKFPPIRLERTTETGLKHRLGTISMPRGDAADSATSGFVICLEDTPSLDFGSKRYPDGQGFAAFGRVVKGMDVVRRIHSQPVKGQSLDPPVTITRIYRLQEQQPQEHQK